MYIDDNGAFAKIFDLGQGWHWRIDPTSADSKIQRHIHIWKDGGPSYAQNEDGSIHDGLSGNPPKWIQKKLQDMKKWSWKDEHTKSIEITPAPSQSPSPSPNPTPAPGPAPVVVPASDNSDAVNYSNQFSIANAFGTVGVVGLIWTLFKIATIVPTGGLSLAMP